MYVNYTCTPQYKLWLTEQRIAYILSRTTGKEDYALAIYSLPFCTEWNSWVKHTLLKPCSLHSFHRGICYCIWQCCDRFRLNVSWRSNWKETALVLSGHSCDNIENLASVVLLKKMQIKLSRDCTSSSQMYVIGNETNSRFKFTRHRCVTVCFPAATGFQS